MTPTRPEWPIAAFGLEVRGGEAIFPGVPPSGISDRVVTVEREPVDALARSHVDATPCEPPGQVEREGFQTLRLADSSFLLDAPGVARVLVSATGRELRFAADGTDDRWPLLVLARGLPLAAALQGLEPLHAAAVRLPDGRFIALAGGSGAGKTSVAAELLLSGATLVCDDVLSLEPRDDGLYAHAGAGWLSLRHDHATSRGEVNDVFGSATVRGGKRFHAVSEVAGPQPLDALYLLSRTDSRDGGVERVEASLADVLGLSFVTVIESAPRRLAQLDALARLAGSVPIFRVRSQMDWTAADTAALIVEG